MLLVLKFQELLMNYHRFFEKNAKTPNKYLTCVFIKIGSSAVKFITNMIRAKNSTNSESINGFGRGR
jgi:hypothetical protein